MQVLRGTDSEPNEVLLLDSAAVRDLVDKDQLPDQAVFETTEREQAPLDELVL